jgi:general secretion pathway protein L
MDLGTALKRLRRAEFIGDGMGLYVGPHELGLAHIHKGLLRVEVREAQTMPLPTTDHPAERRHVLTDAVLGFVRARHLGAAPSVLALHRSFAVFNRIVLPAAAADNLREVVEYEIERIIPIPKSELYYDFTMRAFGAERIEVLVMCVPQAVVREHLDALEDAFLRPRGVVVSSAAIADFFCFCREDAPGPVGFVLGTNGDVEFTLLADQRLVSSVVLPSARTQHAGDIARLVARELTDELVGLGDVALYTAGPSNGSGPLMGAEQLLPLAQNRLQAPPGFFENKDAAVLPAVGAALGAVREGTVAVNLLPAEFRFGEEGSRWLLTAVLSLLLAVALVAWGVSVVARDAMLRKGLQNQLSELEPQVERIKKFEAEASAVRERITTIAGERNRHAVDYLHEVTTILPDDAYLSTFRLRNEQIQLDGFARAASELIPKLEESERFKNVKFASPTTKAQERDRFSITMELE